MTVITREENRPMTMELATDRFSCSRSPDPKLLAVTMASPLPMPRANPTIRS